MSLRDLIDPFRFDPGCLSEFRPSLDGVVNLLVDLAQREVLQGQLELTRLWQTLTAIQTQALTMVEPARITPLAFPIWAERIQAQVSSESWTREVLSNFIKEKSGAESPGCKLPARACVQAVSKGKSKNGTGPGILAMTLPTAR